MLSVGALIWVSVRPLLRLIICTSCGFILTRADLFPGVAARGTGQILLNITMPALIFSKIVPAFTSDNIGALGPLFVVGIVYEVLGVTIAWLVKQFFWVPHRFQYGIIAAGAWSNVGDIPTAVVMSITGSAPFNGSSDQTIAVAYISVFILIFFITLFPMGGFNLIAWDYVGPEVDDEDLRKSVSAKTHESLKRLSRGINSVRKRVISKPNGHDSYAMDSDAEKDPKRIENGGGDIEEDCRRTELAPGSAEVDCIVVEREEDAGCSLPQNVQSPSRCDRQKHVSFYNEADVDDSTTVAPTHQQTARVCRTDDNSGPSRITSPNPSVTRVDSESALATPHGPARPVQYNFSRRHPSAHGNDDDEGSRIPESVGPSLSVQPRSRALRHRIFAHVRTVVFSLLTPQSIAIFTALIISLVPPLKALFTPVENSPIPNAPDGQPPLAFILDTATFIGAASVPMGLVCLGSALARLHVPRSQWRSLPLGAISALAIGKMILMPILGVLIVEGLTSSGLIDANNFVLRLVCIIDSCIPTATTQVYLTQVYSGTGDAAILSAFLIPQYALMFITMTVLSAYTLSLLF